MTQEPTGQTAQSIILCGDLTFAADGTAEAAIANWSPATWELVADREARESAMPDTDLMQITAPTELLIAGHLLQVTPGATSSGRYWQLSTLDGHSVGLVAQHTLPVDGGNEMPVYEAITGSLTSAVSRRRTAAEAAHLIVAALCGTK